MVEYLRSSAGGSDAAARWQPVFEVLRTEPDAPVTKALTTPLMAALAKAIYNPRPKEGLTTIPAPTELLNRTRFQDDVNVKRHLFDKFIPASYRLAEDQLYHRMWNVEKAQRWLTFMACDLEGRQGTTDFSWWRLSGAAPKALSAIAVGLFVGILAAIGFSIPLGKGFSVQHVLDS
jgi:hypothetical protein